ncbi:TorF family putative porin [Psychrobium sp. 1_MG-2023]|uniref:TorF family putative porin n=1 Tax=Psychrobium sp. 1_MG-2023 TaxID=3062624 RepID=UPI000C34024A|nr:TorF family putative porin [Psychrobium sp. 1_MG-2023]MDP2561024.1 TorF family putative porin [Psychrobium sp. 1_MG-2023]PKF58317.1 hypothetical protein CW748_03925 [Alteromonadales bacterium alter-6D02]
MKKTIMILSAALTMTTLYTEQAQAVDGLTANVGVSNNYVWRGISQTSDQAAISGGVDYAASNGFYVGTWASNVDWGDDTSAEVDLYAGYSFEAGELAFDVGYLFYGYPGGDSLDFSEIYASVGWEFLTVGYHTLADSDWDSDFGDSDYLYADLAFEVADGLELGFHYGVSNFDGGGDYSDYGISLSKDNFTLAITDVDENTVESNFLVAVSYSVEFDL